MPSVGPSTFDNAAPADAPAVVEGEWVMADLDLLAAVVATNACFMAATESGLNNVELDLLLLAAAAAAAAASAASLIR